MSDDSVGSGKPPREISFHPTEGGAILFDARQRRLYALNPAAGLTWLCIRDGLSQPETEHAIAEGLGIGYALAADWYRASEGMFRENRLLDHDATASIAPTPDRGRVGGRPQTGGEPQYFAIFDQTLCVHAPVSLQVDIGSLLHLLPAGPPDLAAAWSSQIVIDIIATGHERWEIVVDGHVEAVCDAASVVAELERVIVEAVVPATPHVLTFHAASLQWQNRVVLLAGPSGSGKTTLSTALSHAGWAFGGDEIVLMGPESTFQPLPLPPCIKEESFAVVSNWFPMLRDAPAHQRYGRSIKFLPIPSTRFDPLPGIVVFPNFQKGVRASMTRIDRFEGLQNLLKHCVFVPGAFSHSDVRELLRFQDKVEYYDVWYGSCEDAIDLLEAELFVPR